MASAKSTQLKQVEKEVQDLSESPLYKYRIKEGYHAVVGKGNPDARIMLIGEAPGKQEALRGEPFVGSAGRMLDGMLESVGLSRDDVYITNILKDRTPENRSPQKQEIRLYAPFLTRQIKIIQPSVIVTLGRSAMESILTEFKVPEKGRSITELHGKPLRAAAQYGPVTIVPLFHPAVAFYRRDQKEILKTDFLVLKGLKNSKAAARKRKA